MLIIKLLTKNQKKNLFERANNINKYIDKQIDIPEIINFNASWCKHSLKLEPIWYQLEDKMKTNNIKVINISCDKEENKGICKANKINYFPTIKLFIKNKEYEYTNSTSNLESIIEFTEGSKTKLDSVRFPDNQNIHNF